MRIKETFFIFILILCVYNCRTFNVLNKSNSYCYKGNIKYFSDEKFSLKFRIIIDSFCNMDLKLYSSTGFKIGHFKLIKDTLIINELIDYDYKETIENIYERIRHEININAFLKYFFNGDIFAEKELITKNKNCGLNNWDKNEFIFYSKECKYLFTLKKYSSKKYEIILLNKCKIEISFRKS